MVIKEKENRENPVWWSISGRGVEGRLEDESGVVASGGPNMPS